MSMPVPEHVVAEKSAQLETHLRHLGRLLVAYSGGVDSA